MPISFSGAYPVFLRCFRTSGTPIRKILGRHGVLPGLVPQWPQIMQIRISFRSLSDQFLNADQSLDFLGGLPASLLTRGALKKGSLKQPFPGDEPPSA